MGSGVDYVQVDAPRYSYFVDPKWRQHLRELGEDPDRMFEEAVAADNFVLEGAQGSGTTVALHVCRGNNQSKWYAEGGYEAIAERLFGSLAVDRFLWNTIPTGPEPWSPSGLCRRTEWLSWA